jgi:predicted glycosyltransferase
VKIMSFFRNRDQYARRKADVQWRGPGPGLMHQPRRILFISGSIGLGHAGRDLAIAEQLRRRRPGLEIDWLAGQPAIRMIEEAGESILPEAAAFQETGSAEDSAEGFSLNLTRYATRALSVWARAARAVLNVTQRGSYDLVVGDETYEVAIAFALCPRLKKLPWVIIYDFFGLDAMTSNPLERAMVRALNHIWCGGRRGKPPPFDLTLFAGEPEDVPDTALGWRLPNARAYVRRHFDFTGYALGFDPATYTHRHNLRKTLGYNEHPLIVCSVGGTAVGADLLRRCVAAYPRIRARVANAHMVVVCGPRIDPTTIRAPTGVEVRGYVPRLYEHFAACDVAVVQGGGTSTLELTALRRPFLYFPLDGHAEQNLIVAKRLARHGAGSHQVYSQTTPAVLADAIVSQLGRKPIWPPINTDGARSAAALIDQMLQTAKPGNVRRANAPLAASKRTREPPPSTRRSYSQS